MLRMFVVAFLTLFIGGCITVPGDSIREKTLANGLRVIVKEDHRSPVIVSQVWYKVGSIDEPDGLTGISHVLEHMMFKGTNRFKPGEFSRIVAENGGNDNAFTARDYTGYFEMLEKSRLPISFDLEADRMWNLRLLPDEFTKERAVVIEERRRSTEDRPEALLWEKFMATAYQRHSYKNPIIGTMRDLEHLKIEDLRDWYTRYYAPNNAIVVVAGDVVPEEVFALAEKYFGAVARREVNPYVSPGEPPQNGERRTRVAAPAEVPHVMMGYHVPSLTTPGADWEPYALEVAAAVLDGGNAARFARELVRDKKIASSAGAGYDAFDRAPGLFVLDGVPASGRNIKEVETALRVQIARLHTEPVTEEELKRVKAQVVAADVFARDSVFNQARRLGAVATVGLDPRLVDRYPERIKAVTAEQVQAVARKYFVDTNLTVAVLDPLSIKRGRRPAPMRGGHAR